MEPGAPESIRKLLHHTPLFLFVLIAVSVFVLETSVMLLLSALQPLALWIQVLVDAGLLVLLLFPVLFFFMFRPMRRQISELFATHERLQSEIAARSVVETTLRDSEKQLRFLSAELLRTQEKERRRISRELHEELGVTLAALKLGLRFILRNLREDQQDLRIECEEYLESFDRLIGDIRRLSRELSPSPLEDTGLSAALRKLVSGAARDCGMEVDLDLEDIDHLFPPEAQINIYRLFQEAVSNAEKHSQASRISMAVSMNEGNVSFSLEDNGKGMDVSRTEMKVGLTTMFERARILGGSLQVSERKEGGTRIVLKLPAPR